MSWWSQSWARVRKKRSAAPRQRVLKLFFSLSVRGADGLISLEKGGGSFRDERVGVVEAPGVDADGEVVG